MAPHRDSPAPPGLVTLVSCCLLAAAWGATRAQAAAPRHAAHDLRMDAAAPQRTLMAHNQTLINVLTTILDDPHGAGAPSFLQLSYAAEAWQRSETLLSVRGMLCDSATAHSQVWRNATQVVMQVWHACACGLASAMCLPCRNIIGVGCSAAGRRCALKPTGESSRACICRAYRVQDCGSFAVHAVGQSLGVRGCQPAQ
jgi:hypothetical protein